MADAKIETTADAKQAQAEVSNLRQTIDAFFVNLGDQGEELKKFGDKFEEEFKQAGISAKYATDALNQLKPQIDDLRTKQVAANQTSAQGTDILKGLRGEMFGLYSTTQLATANLRDLQAGLAPLIEDMQKFGSREGTVRGRRYGKPDAQPRLARTVVILRRSSTTPDRTCEIQASHLLGEGQGNGGQGDIVSVHGPLETVRLGRKGTGTFFGLHAFTRRKAETGRKMSQSPAGCERLREARRLSISVCLAAHRHRVGGGHFKPLQAPPLPFNTTDPASVAR